MAAAKAVKNAITITLVLGGYTNVYWTACSMSSGKPGLERIYYEIELPATQPGPGGLEVEAADVEEFEKRVGTSEFSVDCLMAVGFGDRVEG